MLQRDDEQANEVVMPEADAVPAGKQWDTPSVRRFDIPAEVEGNIALGGDALTAS